MNPVEIEEAVSELAETPFDAAEFPFQFLEAFGNKEVTLKKLRLDPAKAGSTNKSDLGGVCQRTNIHIKVCAPGEVSQTIAALRDSKATSAAKVKFILATDGVTLEAEDLASGEPVVCDYAKFADHFGFFSSLAGLSFSPEIKENPIDIKATGRLKKLYVQIIRDNPEWDGDARRQDLNHFMARLIFCFFAEDTDILNGENLFTETIAQFAQGEVSVEFVMGEVFRAMNIAPGQRAAAKLPNWANVFPYVNGGLFNGSPEVPKFSKIARAYFLRIGALNWQEINPDIFGSMIQAVADKAERSALGMHYTSVPSILKVLNPLFLDELQAELAAAGNVERKLTALRARLSKIRVFDPACGSGNFLVIAYKQMREIEAEINQRLKDRERRTEIPPTNFRGIEINHFPAEIARLALIIAEYQCDVKYRGQKEALATFLPLDEKNWIEHANALRVDWLTVCPPTGQKGETSSTDLLETLEDKARIQIDFDNEGGETYICGNPPYLGSKWQDAEQKEDLRRIFDGRTKSWKSLDYVAGWFMKSADYAQHTPTVSALVSTNSICQGEQVPILWPLVFNSRMEIRFAHTSFKWRNLASKNAGVTVAIIAIGDQKSGMKILYDVGEEGEVVAKEVENINAYLVPGPSTIIEKKLQPISNIQEMIRGNHPYYANALMLTQGEARDLRNSEPASREFLRPLYGSKECISGVPRACIWIKDSQTEKAAKIDEIHSRVQQVASLRSEKRKDAQAQKLVETPHRFRDQHSSENSSVIIPVVSSENRSYLPFDLLDESAIIHNKAFLLKDAPLWNMALIASRIHWVWIGTVCVRMRTDFSYSNTLGWNTFPVPDLTEKNKADLTRCAEAILLAREAHFPATIADLYNPKTMPKNLADAHETNDETIERIYTGRRFKNDTERLEHLFQRYTQITTKPKGTAT